ncbi:hypothetical protein KIPB_001493 [Kipferlia bialata]|uniref:Uncharacterized protein n=2 Tax=Kipferlia bialata TaxID=797122 RepID=A0A9K3CQQ2_9EUKA|nr:hypothetical protein KIPB_001493 [Kipferlia bialata]|eukprot:g1493.t1
MYNGTNAALAATPLPDVPSLLASLPTDGTGFPSVAATLHPSSLSADGIVGRKSTSHVMLSAWYLLIKCLLSYPVEAHVSGQELHTQSYAALLREEYDDSHTRCIPQTGGKGVSLTSSETHAFGPAATLLERGLYPHVLRHLRLYPGHKANPSDSLGVSALSDSDLETLLEGLHTICRLSLNNASASALESTLGHYVSVVLYDGALLLLLDNVPRLASTTVAEVGATALHCLWEKQRR